MPYNIKHVLAQDAAKLAEALTLDAKTVRIEVQCLLQQALNVPRAYLLAHPERSLSEPEQVHYEQLLQRRLRGEPVAYILGEREFFGLTLNVTPAVLIPRPETELLVELALQRIPPHDTRRMLDLGTGSGAIALAVAHSRPEANCWASDASPQALMLARANAERLGIGNVTFIQSDWYAALDAQHFDLILSNPPYIASGDAHLQQGDLRFEPMSALISGSDGLQDIRRIITDAPAHLLPGGWLLLEHGYDQATQVRGLLGVAGFDEIFSAVDLADIERVSGGCIT